MDVAFGYLLPPFRQSAEGLLTVKTVAHQVTANGGPRPADPAPAMEVDFAACAQAFFNLVQDGFHQCWRGQSKISDGEAVILGVHAVRLPLLTQNFRIGIHLIWPGEIDESIKTRLDETIQPPARLFGVKMTRVFTRQKTAGFDPVGLGNGALVVAHPGAYYRACR